MRQRNKSRLTNCNKRLVCVIACGPSLTKQDCELIGSFGCPTICVSYSYKLAPFCDIVYASDFKFWNCYFEDIRQFRKEKNSNFEMWTCSQRASKEFEINFRIRTGDCLSGFQALQFALELKFEKIILIGFDNSVKNGTHFDGNHLRGLSNPTDKDCARWKNYFKRISKDKADVVNCSRFTELLDFRIGILEQELC